MLSLVPHFLSRNISMFGIIKETTNNGVITIEYCTSSSGRGMFSTDINRICMFNQESSALKQAKKFTKHHEDNVTYSTVEIVFSIGTKNEVHVDKKHGIVIVNADNEYYYGAKNPNTRTYGHEYFTDVIGSSTIFKSTSDALECIDYMVKSADEELKNRIETCVHYREAQIGYAQEKLLRMQKLAIKEI